jgi:hypothetical protein
VVAQDVDCADRPDGQAQAAFEQVEALMWLLGEEGFLAEGLEPDAQQLEPAK